MQKIQLPGRLGRSIFFLTSMSLFSASALVATTSAAAENPDISNAAVVEAFVDGSVKAMMKKEHSPSGVVAVMKDGEMIFAKGYGHQHIEQNIPVDPETTLFRPGSISKLFTWVSVMQLVEQGKLDLDVDVNQYLKSVSIDDSWPGQPITLRHIMTHTPGFEDGFLGYLIIDDPTRIMPLSESMIKYQPQRVNPPGTHTAYSNYATSIAGLIVENVSGQKFNDYVQSNIFDVLDMEYATFVEPLPEKLAQHMAQAYGFALDKYVEKNYEIISNFGPAGASAMSAIALSKFARAFLNGGEYEGRRILKEATVKQMLSRNFSHDDRTRGIALGFLEYPYNGIEIIGHDGGTTVFLSHLGLSLKENLMLFSSFSGPGAGIVHTAFVKSFYDEFFPPDVPRISAPEDFSTRAEKYVGSYHPWRSNFNGLESISRIAAQVNVLALEDNTLLVGETRFVELENNLFRAVNSDRRIAFQENASGEITGLVNDGVAVSQAFRAPFYATFNFSVLSLGFCLIVFAGVFIRLLYQRASYKALPADEKSAVRASIFVAIANLGFITLFVLTTTIYANDLMYRIPGLLTFSLVFPILAALAAFYHLYQSILVWRNGLCAGIGIRIRYSVITACALFMLWFYAYWNLLGFNYF